MPASAIATKADLTPERRPYRPYGAALALMLHQGPEVLVSGPASTGKSRACLEKLHLCADAVPRLRALIVRRTRESLTEAALVTFEEKVVPEGHPVLATGGQRRMRQAYHYPNGSAIVVGGLDKPGKIMSTEYDLVFVQEAIELSEESWEALTTRLRNGRLPYQQLLADTNPDRPTHWLKRRCDAGRTVLLESRHEDNPTVTPAYLARLDALTGARYHRLRRGLWVQAEGVVYEGWDPAVHLVDRFPIPKDWPRLLAIDFGFTNPFVAQWWAVDGDGRLYRYREIYRTQRLVEDHARDILELSGNEPPPVAVVCDHDAEGRATLEKYTGWETTPAIKMGAKVPGIEAVQARLRKAGDGRPRITFLRDSLVERDPELDAAKRPCCTEEEFESYVWDKRLGRESPVKENDHGLDAMRYLVWGLDCDEAASDGEGTTVARVL